MHEKFLRPYSPKETEDAIYARSEHSGFFNPDTCVAKGVTKPDAEPFSIVLPPPNVTGTLHMGHAAMLAIEDALVRFARMRGKRTLWLPGTDHAAIATQAKVEEALYKREKKTKHDLGRERFLALVEEFARESRATITRQIRKMGSSVDWSREAYTLDEERSHAVRAAFVAMYEDGLVYRGARIVNWDPKLQTVVSDDEVEWKEERAPFYHLAYGPFMIGTARPETKFGDKYVVVHPEDRRYAAWTHGEKIAVEWLNGPITATVIKDPAVDPSFGTGAMTITPAHDAADFEIAKRHNLDIEPVIDFRGILLPLAGEFAGEHIRKARPRIVEKMKEKGLLARVDENYVHRVATNSRGGGLIEPQVKEQWFVAVEKPFALKRDFVGMRAGERATLKDVMRRAVESGEIEIIPERFAKVYFHWIENLRDWCVSRQIWFGHRIPAWFKGEKVHVGLEGPGEPGWEQDPDTLDTWFSSGLWTFSTLGWPKKTKDLETYHPTSILETGYDILFFWVARMILMAGYHLGEIPFRKVYLHGLVRDERGRKMSKSLGNVIDPLDMIEKYGADATRLSLVVGTAPGNDLKLSEDRVRGYKHFANKVWNIARFVLENAGDGRGELRPDDEALVAEARGVASVVAEHLERFRLDLAADEAYRYVWHRFADVILEESKPILKGNDEGAAASRRSALYAILVTSLKTLHPFMPFVTEEIWTHLPEKDADLLMAARWPA